jgi:hypothetical protein
MGARGFRKFPFSFGSFGNPSQSPSQSFDPPAPGRGYLFLRFQASKTRLVTESRASQGNVDQGKQHEALLRERDAANFLGVSMKFLQTDRRKWKRIPFVKLGFIVRYDPADLIAYRDSCKVRAEIAPAVQPPPKRGANQ